MTFKKLSVPALLVAFVLFAASCSKNDKETPTPDKTTTKTILIEDLPAAPNTDNTGEGQPEQTSGYTLFRFSDSTIVANSDSATAKWNIGFNATTIIVNNAIHGPGNTTAQLVSNKLFNDLTQIPESGYRADSLSGNVFADWYSYNMTTHQISPVPGTLFILKTSDGKYVKMEILSYYKGYPEEGGDSRYYTFKYKFMKENSN